MAICRTNIISWFQAISAIKNSLLLAIMVITISFYSAPSAKAQIILPNLINQDQVTRIQDREIQKQQIQREQEAIKRKKNLRKKPKRARRVHAKKVSTCFKISKFEFNKNSLISQKKLEKITSKYLEKCFTKHSADNIKSEIYAKISQKGYITSQIILPQQNVSTGIAKFEIIPGKINKAQLNNDNFSDKIQKFMLFGNLNEKTLNVNNINQGLQQLNKLPSSNSKVKIVAADKEGYSNILVSNKNSFPLRAKIAHDNLGNDFTGIKRTTFSSSADNLLSLSENINLSFTNNLNDSNSKKEMEAVSTSIAIPFRYYTISYNYSDTDYMGKVESDGGQFTVNGYSRRKSLTLERSLVNNQSYSLSILSSLIIKDTGSQTLLNGPVNSSRKKLSIIDLSMSFSKSTKDFGIYLKPSILQGIGKFGADKDSSQDPIDQAKNQYRTYRLYFNATKPIQIGEKRIIFSSEFDGQISQDTLHGSEQFSIGGYYSIRGFRENYISGDHGYYSRNKFNINLGSFLSSAVKNYPLIARKLHALSIEPFFDYGQVRDKVTSVSGRLSGTGISAIYNGKYFDGSLTYSKGLTRSKLIDPTSKKEDQLIYFQISAGF